MSDLTSQDRANPDTCPRHFTGSVFPPRMLNAISGISAFTESPVSEEEILDHPDIRGWGEKHYPWLKQAILEAGMAVEDADGKLSVTEQGDSVAEPYYNTEQVDAKTEQALASKRRELLASRRKELD